MKEVKEKPSINVNSDRIIKHMKREGSFISRLTNHKPEKTIIENVNKDFIGKPKINKKSKQMFKDKEKLKEWEQKKIEQQKIIADKIVLI